MKTQLFSLLSVLLLLSSCGGGGYNPPIDNPGKNPNNGGNSETQVNNNPVAAFSYTTSQPCYVHFTNNSSNATSYEWDFGDGNKSTEKSPTHKYAGKGVYEVTLKAIYAAYSKRDICKKTITIKEPTSCYVTGIVYNKIPNNNEYYNIRFTDDYLFFETLYWSTDWVLLSSANTPYTYNLKSKKKIDFANSKYVMRLCKNTKTSGKGTELDAWLIQTKNIQSKFWEEITGTTNNAEIKLILTWED